MPIMGRAVYQLMAERCDQCLTTPNRIVSTRRAAQLMAQCRSEDIKFICHQRDGIACRGVHELTGGCRAYRMAKAFGIEVVEVAPTPKGEE
jgi:hypothetical protein